MRKTSLYIGGLALTAVLSVAAEEWMRIDVGNPLTPSFVAENNGEVTVVSHMPSSAEGTADYLTLACQRWSGDFVLEAEVACATDTFPNGQTGRLGLFVRESRADPGGRFVSLGVGRKQNMFLELRRASGVRRESYNAICGNPASKRFQLKRVGNVFEAHFGDGASGPLAYFVTTELDLARDVWVGFGVRPDGLDAPVRGVFRNVALRAPNAEEARALAFRAEDPVVWRAATCGVRDGESVPLWSDAAHACDASVRQCPKGVVAPLWTASAMNGHSALSFDGSNTLLSVKASGAPMGDAYRGTVACVFRTASSVPGSMVSCDASYAPDQLADDWRLSLDADGAVSAMFGFVFQWDAFVRSRQVRLNDGRPHVAIFSWGGEGRSLRLNVDGQVSDRVFTFWRKRAFLKTAIGGDPNGERPSFMGDLAEIVFIKNHALSWSEENRLGWALAERYGVSENRFVRITDGKSDACDLSSALVSPEAVVLRHPQNCAVKRGQTADFEVAAKACEYQWYRDGQPLEGLTAARLRVATGAMPPDCCGATFECRVSNGRCAMFSRKAMLRIE